MNNQELVADVEAAIGKMKLSDIYRHREAIAWEITGTWRGRDNDAVVDAIRKSAVCYAGLLSTMRAGHKGYADQFEIPKLFRGRMREAAQWGPPSKEEQAAKPWLQGCRRLIFVSDMGDALSSSVPFEYLEAEIIRNVASPEGRRHIWLWLSKRPARMTQFADWLKGRGVEWPHNLMPMTTVTSQATAPRIDQLRRVPAKLRGLSVEPLFEKVELDLRGINWIVAGGSSDVLAAPFHVEWALSLREQCKRAGAAFFLKQLGKNPDFEGAPLKLKDRHGGNWAEWPSEWRIREVPAAFREGEV